MTMGVTYDERDGWNQIMKSSSALSILTPSIQLSSDVNAMTARLYVIPEMGFNVNGFLELLVKPRPYINVEVRPGSSGSIAAPLTHASEAGYIFVCLESAEVYGMISALPIECSFTTMVLFVFRRRELRSIVRRRK
jgi:hypothetical protein